jgi:U32 family peptidase
MSDPGLMMMARELCPEIDIHLSVQANCMNYQSVKFWKSMGVKRIILSRELRLSEIREIHDQVPDIELEAFVHGSICIAYSGRCLLSHYMSYRDANQGVCDNSCRYGYQVHHTSHSASQGDYYLEDLRNKGELYPMEEDEHGTYIMNAKDLCLLPHIKELQEAGVVSLKVEGRTKSVYYVAQVARIYRKALRDLEQGLPFDPQGLEEIKKVANRGLHTGFLMGLPTYEAQNYDSSSSREQVGRFAGLVVLNDQGQTQMEARNRLAVGDSIEVITPDFQYQDKITAIHQGLKQHLNAAHGGAGLYDIETASGQSLPLHALVITKDVSL